jgi:hypothetical protein
MSDPNDRVQDALAAHLEHIELGGPAPDLSGLSPAEREQLDGLVRLLDQTGGVAFGRGLDADPSGPVALTPYGELLLAVLREAVPPDARIVADPSAPGIDIEGMAVAEGWIIGTFGGRIRLWLLEGADALAGSEAWLRGLERVFRLYSDTAAVALVDRDLQCLLVQPEDCAPTIEVPRGSLVGRRYRRPIHPVAEALSVFIAELIPYWEPMRDIAEHTESSVDVRTIAHERAAASIGEQAAAGARARRTNPKRKALTELGDDDADRVAKLVLDVHDGRAELEGIEERLRRSAKR